jgi:heat shock protein HslJ
MGMTPRLTLPALLACAGLLLLGCGDGAEPPTRADDGGIGGEYLSDGLPQPPFPDGSEPIRLTLAEGTISFTSSCNHFSGNATWDDGVLRVSGLGGTEMGCPGQRQAQDDWMIDFFGAEPSLHLDGTDVRFSSADVDVWFVPLSETQQGEDGDADDLLGTDWTLTSVAEYDGDDGSVSSLPEGTQAVLRLEDDEVVFSTGCNSGSGPAVVEGDTIRFGDLAMTLRGCDRASGELESSVLTVLQGTVGWSITGDELRLRSADGKHELIYSR